MAGSWAAGVATAGHLFFKWPCYLLPLPAALWIYISPVFSFSFAVQMAQGLFVCLAPI